MRDEQFGFSSRRSTSLQLLRLVEWITRNFGEKRLTGAVFLDVAKAFDTVWIDGLFYTLTLVTFSYYIVHTTSSYLRDRTFEASLQTATSSHRRMQGGVAQGGLTSIVFFIQYVNYMPSPSHHVKLAVYADDTAIISTSCKPTLLVSYLESYLNDLRRWLSEWRMTIKICRSTTRNRACRTTLHAAQTSNTIRGTNPVDRQNSLSGVYPSHMTHLVDSRLSVQEEGCLWVWWVPSWIRRHLSVRNGVLLYKQLIRSMMDYACPAWRSASRTHVRRLQVLKSKCLHLATFAPSYVCNRQKYEDLEVPLFADHLRALTENFDSKLADVGNPLLRQLDRYLRWPRVDPVALRESEGRKEPAGVSSILPPDGQINLTNRVQRWAAESHLVNLTKVFLDFPRL